MSQRNDLIKHQSAINDDTNLVAQTKLTVSEVSLAEYSPSQFLAGFVCGVLAGAGTVFLLQNDRGKQLTAELKREWENARQQFYEDGLISHPKLTLWQVFKQLINS